MTRSRLNKPVQRAQPYAPNKNAQAGAGATANHSLAERSEELHQLKSVLNSGASVQRLSALQRVANTGAAQRADDEEAQLKAIPAQRAEDEEAQLKTATVQRADDEEAQLKSNAESNGATVQAKFERGGLPGDLKAGIETISGMSMDGVKVHRNSSKPAAVQAHAYAQGSDIHLGPGQEKHLPHEAWHIVQQAQGRVKPTMQMAGVSINDDTGLEREADVMGAKANSAGSAAIQQRSFGTHSTKYN